jgi:hypothetical protein
MADFEIKLSNDDVERVAVRIVDLLTNRPQPAALNNTAAARYIGVSRTRWYELLLVDPKLADGAIVVGSRRLWPVGVLDRWIARHKGKRIETRPRTAGK